MDAGGTEMARLIAHILATDRPTYEGGWRAGYAAGYVAGHDVGHARGLDEVDRRWHQFTSDARPVFKARGYGALVAARDYLDGNGVYHDEEGRAALDRLDDARRDYLTAGGDPAGPYVQTLARARREYLDARDRRLRAAGAVLARSGPCADHRNGRGTAA